MADQPPVDVSAAGAENAKKNEKKAAKQERIAAAKARKEQLEKEKALKEQQQQQQQAVKKEDEVKIRLREDFVNTTKPGEKKDMSAPFADTYNPAQVEAAWYDWWQAKGYFEANVEDKEKFKGKFVMVIPPPNVTGSLHLGHALTNAVEDTICRFHRMKGKQVVWVPGCDHAGIATQVVVEKQLMREQQLTRHDLGREKFIAKVWEWKEEKGNRIYEQLKRLGSSLDWRRAAFTLDEPRQKAVMEAFVRMHQDGLIYRATRLVNWCCTLKTAISDIEVDYIELKGKTKRKVPGYPGTGFDFGIIEDFGYDIVEANGEPVLDAEGKPAVLIISTTRLETMLGDTAVAIHPDDARYKQWHGKYVYHPYRKVAIPIILDKDLVKMDKGTGCVKVTPAHDPNDYACGKRHDLPFINIFTDDGLVNDIGGELYGGKKRYDVRIAIRKDLQARGKHFGIRENPMQIAVCSRSGDIIEPLLKPQWWVNCDHMAAEAIRVVKENEMEIIPSKFISTWNYWMENIQPWCISRQLWWGHRIPAWLVYKKDASKPTGENDSDWIVARTFEEAQQLALEKFKVESVNDLEFHQDEDVLDTWFSSGLFPFSVFGWPDETEDLKHFYPIELMETGHDILFFWVARMVMMGMHLTGKVPFRQVFLHAIVRDAHGRKMSKTLGNVIDPIDVIEGITLKKLHERLEGGNLDPSEVKKAVEGQKQDFPKGISECGTDALRLTLCTYTSQGENINLNVNQIVADRNFCNKMWNVVRFAMKFFPANYNAPAVNFALNGPHRKEDAWILSRLNEAIEKANSGLHEYVLGRSTLSVKDFILKELCDVYLESLKPLMYREDTYPELLQHRAIALDTLYICLENVFRLLHPFMPFVTEELWQRLPRRPSDPESIMIAEYPSVNEAWKNPAIEAEMAVILEIIHTTRRVRAEYGLTKQKPFQSLRTSHQPTFDFLGEYISTVAFLCQSDDKVRLLREGEVPEGEENVTVIVPGTPVEMFLNLEGMIDLEKEIGNLEKRIGNLDKSIQALQKKRNEKTYASKVPENIQLEDQQKLDAALEEKGKAETAVQNMKAMQARKK